MFSNYSFQKIHIPDKKTKEMLRRTRIYVKYHDRP